MQSLGSTPAAGRRRRRLQRGSRAGQAGSRAGQAGSRRGQGGFGLVEVAITIVIMGVALVTLIGSMATTETVSNLTAQRTQLEGYARHLAETVRSPTFGWYTCSPPTVLAALPSLPAGYTASIPNIVWTADPMSIDPSTWDGNPGCQTPPALERVTIQVSAISNPKVFSTIVVIKRNTTGG